jgi:hypothetical protein
MRPAIKVVFAWLIAFSYVFVLAGTKERGGFPYLFKTTLLFILEIVVLLLHPSIAVYLYYS